MHIGVLTTSYPRFEGDVPGTFVEGMAIALATRGHTLEVLAPEAAEPHEGAVRPGIAVHRIPYLRPRRLERTFYGAGVPDNLRRDPLAWLGLAPWSAMLAVEAARRVGGWDAVISHWLLPSGLVAAAVRGRRPHLAVSHSADTHLLSRLPGGGAIAGRLLHGASALLFASGEGRQRFGALLSATDRAHLQSRAHVGPMGIDPPAPKDRALRRRVRGAMELEGLVALVLGRLVPIKGVADLAVALRREPGITVLVAGEGPERGRIERAFRDQGVRARLCGAVSGARKREVLAAADCLVVPSRRLASGRTEGTPTAALEAMAAGLPVVATGVGGLREIVEDGQVGRIVPAGDLNALGAAIRSLRDDAPGRRRMGERAARRARRYWWSELAPAIEQLLSGEL